MTCIVGVVESDGAVHLAGDSNGAIESAQFRIAGGKLWRLGEIVFGSSGSTRIRQVLAHALKLPEHPEDMSTDTYLVTKLGPALRECLKDHGALQASGGVEWLGNMLVVGYRGKLVRVAGDFGIGESQADCTAIGCGSDVAIGALLALADSHRDEPHKRLTRALEIAEECTAGVRGPFTYLSTAPVSLASVSLAL